MGLTERFSEDFALLFLIHPGVHLQLTAVEAWSLMATIQLACRHPEWEGPTRDIAMAIGKLIEEALATTPALKQVAEIGWRKAHDVTIDRGPSFERMSELGQENGELDLGEADPGGDVLDRMFREVGRGPGGVNPLFPDRCSGWLQRDHAVDDVEALTLVTLPAESGFLETVVALCPECLARFQSLEGADDGEI